MTCVEANIDVFIHSVIENRYNFFALWVFHKHDERGCIDKNLHRLMEEHNFAQFRCDFYVNFMIVERACIDKNAHRLMERYNLAQFRRDFNMNFMLSERGCIRKTIHRLVVSIQARSVCSFACSGFLYLSVSTSIIYVS